MIELPTKGLTPAFGEVDTLFTETEVSQHQVGVFPNDDIFGLEVTVNDIFGVQCLNGEDNFTKIKFCLLFI